MDRIDVNCLLGHWPFRKIRKNTFEDLQTIHKQNNIDYGYVSSLNSIFYNDPFEGDLELHEIIKNTDYKHVLTVNPALPGVEGDIERGAKLFDIRGVRIYPGFHGYKLTDRCVTELCTILKKYNLPLFITVRMDDERLTYIYKPDIVKADELKAFAQENPDVTTILLNIRSNEIWSLKELLNSRSNLLIDTSGFKGELFIVERLLSTLKPENIVYGSLYPLYALQGSLLPVIKAEVTEEVKSKIFSDINRTL